MADERTVSAFTRINTPLRNAQLLSTVADITQIAQFYKYDPMVRVDDLLYMLYSNYHIYRLNLHHHLNLLSGSLIYSKTKRNTNKK